MKQKNTLVKLAKLLLFVTFILGILMLQQSCKKKDYPLTEIENSKDGIENFLMLPNNSDSQLHKITEILKLQLYSRNYISDFKNRFGFPLWKEAKLLNKKSRKDEWIIPTVKNGTTEISGFIYTKLDVNNKYMFNVYSKIELEKIISKIPIVAENYHSILNIFAAMEYSINNIDSINFKPIKVKITNNQINQFKKTNKVESLSIDYSTTCTITYLVCTVCYQIDCPYTTIIGISCEGGGDGGGIPGGTTLPLTGGGGNSGGGTNIQGFFVQTLDQTEILNPCIQSVISSIGEAGCSSLLLKLYQGLTVNQNTPYKIKFKENGSLIGNSGNPVFGKTDPITTLPNGTEEITINLNTTMLQNASKEFIATVILHELTHSFYSINVPTSTEYQQHLSIFGGGALKIGQSLIELFSNLSPVDATALALTGLDDVILDANGNPDPTRNTYAETNYGMGVVFARNRGLEYSNGTKGTHC